MRVLWGAAGVTSLGLGIVGTVLPLLPTVPFVILAAYCFSRSSDRLHDWLLEHAVFGRMIEDWRTRGAIRRRAKVMATLSIVFVFGLSLAMRLDVAVLAIQGVVLSLVLTFIWTRPEG